MTYPNETNEVNQQNVTNVMIGGRIAAAFQRREADTEVPIDEMEFIMRRTQTDAFEVVQLVGGVERSHFPLNLKKGMIADHQLSEEALAEFKAVAQLIAPERSRFKKLLWSVGRWMNSMDSSLREELLKEMDEQEVDTLIPYIAEELRKAVDANTFPNDVYSRSYKIKFVTDLLMKKCPGVMNNFKFQHKLVAHVIEQLKLVPTVG